MVVPSVKLPRDVEADEPIVATRTSSRDLTERRAEAVRDVQLKGMSARAAFDAEGDVRRAITGATHPRCRFTDQVHGPAHPQACTNGQDYGITPPAIDPCGVGDPQRLDVHRATLGELARDDEPQT